LNYKKISAEVYTEHSRGAGGLLESLN